MAASGVVTMRILSYEASIVEKLYIQVLHRGPEDSELLYSATASRRRAARYSDRDHQLARVPQHSSPAGRGERDEVLELTVMRYLESGNVLPGHYPALITGLTLRCRGG